MRAEPVEHRLVRLRGGVGVVARAGVVEEGVVDAVEHPHLVGQAGRGQGGLGVRRAALTRSSSPA